MDETYEEDWSVDIEIILLCSRLDLSSSQVTRLVALCRGKSGWQGFYELVASHRVLPLVHRNLRKYCADLLPQEVAAQGSNIFRTNGARNLMMTGYLVRVVSLLADHAIQAVPFKGPALALALYGDSSLRTFCDIDVLINHYDLPAAVKLLSAIGFLPPFSLDDWQLRKLSGTDNEFPLVHKTSGVTLDLQWEITGGYFPVQMTLADLADRLQVITIGGRNMPVLADEDLLFYLCIHGNQHTWKQLDHVCCIAGLLHRNPQLNWDAVFMLAEKYRALRMLSIGLLVAVELLGSEIPKQYVTRLNDDTRTVDIAHNISQQLQNTSTMLQQSADTVSHRFMKYHLLSMDSPYLAVRYAFRLLFLPTRYDWQCNPLPSSMAWLYYLIRPFRLAREYFATSGHGVEMKK